MKEVKTIRTYNLVDSKGNKLQLELGIADVRRDDKPYSPDDKGYRWRFIGKSIPMPVRSRSWFNGFPEHIMLEWLKGNGWYPHTRVECGYAHVYELPKGDEDCSTSVCDKQDKEAFEDTVRDLVKKGKRITATRLCRYVHKGTLSNAYHILKEICGETID